MDFLDRFSPRDRERLLAAATTLRLGRGQLLLRRGERGGDLFRVAEGELEVVDTRSQPVIVLDVVGRGNLVGEMSFLQENVRSADVRAPEGATCLRWERAALLRLFEQEPLLGAGFYRALATLLAERNRATVTNAVAGGMGAAAIPRGPTNDAASADGRALAVALCSRFMELEPLLRRDRAAAERELGTALRNFQAALGEALARMSDEDGREAGRVVSRELHPYTMRSHLGELALDRDGGALAAHPMLAHVLANRVGGDGPLGELIDAWLLGLPTCKGLRERAALALGAVLDAMDGEPPFRVLVVNAAGGLVPALVEQLRGRAAAEITCIDGDRAALAGVEAAVGARPRELRVRLVQDDLGALCLGRSTIRFAPQQILVLDALLEHLPERVVASLLQWARGHLAPGGALVATALLPSADDPVFRHVLDWPLVRRTRASTVRLLESSGFSEVRAYEAAGAGLVVTAR